MDIEANADLVLKYNSIAVEDTSTINTFVPSIKKNVIIFSAHVSDTPLHTSRFSSPTRPALASVNNSQLSAVPTVNAADQTLIKMEVWPHLPSIPLDTFRLPELPSSIKQEQQYKPLHDSLAEQHHPCVHGKGMYSERYLQISI
jgi:hypothetical protein